MSYEDHLKKHSEKEIQDRANLEKQWEDEKTALRVACVGAEKIIHEVIFPELEKLQAAIEAAGKPCTLKISKKKIKRIEADFEVEISLDHRITDKLVFTADPQDKTFSGFILTGASSDNTPIFISPYTKITTKIVTAMCERFLMRAFPI